ncbi:hypothetical protein RJ639_039414 [Escallonia herrerae]|uniref:RRM domain-containing protein n=1 Tax=Escallonia herrerae TaxID=1293975 RepID=A0AA89B7Z9_9ASTE|nr:hypothetical protein RJ639_039414 [Escallonia herrerae]
MMQQPMNGGMVPQMPPQMAPMSIDQQQQQYQQQYQQPPPTWQMPPPLQQQQPPQAPPIWAQQPPQAAGIPSPQQQQLMQAQYGAASPMAAQTDEIRSLWIGDLQYWMDETYIQNCFVQTGELVSVKIIRNKLTQQPEGYGFLEFRSRAAAERTLQAYNGSLMPNSEQAFRLNWATLGAGERHQDDTPDYCIFVGDLAADVTDYTLQETFKAYFQTVKGAKVVTDKVTGRSRGYGFVRFADEGEQQRAMSEMQGVLCSTRAMRIGPAANKKAVGGQQFQKVPYQSPQGSQGESDPNNTTIFVGGLDPHVAEDTLRQIFGQYGELVHVKIPVGKRCGFVQFANRANAEQALSLLNGTQIGGQNVRLSWGRSPSNKQGQPDQTQWNSAYYGYGQGYDPYTYAQPPQDPNAYYGAYSGYGNFQQPQQVQLKNIKWKE